MASKTSGRGRTTTQKKTTAKKRTTAKRQAENDFIRDEILVLSLFAVSVLLLLSNFGIGGAVGSLVSGLMFGVFGLFAYVLPVCLFLVAAFSISNRENLIATIKGAAFVLAAILLCAVIQLVSGEKGGEGTMQAFFLYSKTHHTGGGVVGGFLCKILTGAFGTAGSWIILAVLLICCAVIITERSFLSGVKSGSRKAYDTAKEDAVRRRIRAEERRRERQAYEEEHRKARLELEEEQKRARVERKVSGVAMDSTVIAKPEHTDEMREITLSADAEPDLKNLDEMFQIPIHREHPETFEEPEEIEPVQEEAEPEVIQEPIQEPELYRPEPVYKSAPELPNSSEQKQTAPVTVQRMTSPRTQSKTYIYPPLKLLKQVKNPDNKNTDRLLHETAAHLQQILHDFGVSATVTDVSCGPAVTRYEVQPDQGVKVSKIVALADDIKLNLAVADIRIEAPIPGKAAVGIEVPNAENSIVSFRDLVASSEFKHHKSRIAFAVGKDIAGKIMVTDIAKMPHLLIAGATGSGKSVCINTLIMSILYKASPDEVKLIMVDPKVVELSTYNGIPHLLIPVVTDPKKAAGALNWAVAEMTKRYKLFADYNVRNLAGYNEKLAEAARESFTQMDPLPQIVIVVDELADLMMVAPGEVEDAICRLAQLARAAGIHLIIATQRPSVNVITGLIKANMPSRIAFAVSSGVDSRTILDMNGAEKLLGKGDMLFYPYGYPKPVRVQGAFVSDEEVEAVVEFLVNNNSETSYSSEVEEQMNQVQNASVESVSADSGPERDALFAEAGKFIIEKDKASIGMLQRWFKVGFNRAARIMDQLAEAGVVGEEAGTKPREILMTMEEFDRYIEEYV